MTGDWLLVQNICYEPDQKPPVEKALDWFFAHGCETDQNGGSKRCHLYIVDEMDMPTSGIPVDDALQRLQSSEGFIRFWLDDLRFDFHNWEFEGMRGMPDLPYHSLKFERSAVAPSGDPERCRANAKRVARFAASFAESMGSFYAFGGQAAGELPYHAQDAELLLEGTVERLFWFNYFTERFIDRIGRDRLSTSSAELLEACGPTSVLLLPWINPNPRSQGDVPSLESIEAELEIRDG